MQINYANRIEASEEYANHRRICNRFCPLRCCRRLRLPREKCKTVWAAKRSFVKCGGAGIALIEQRLTFLLEITGRGVIEGHGKIAPKGRPKSRALVRMSGANGWRYDTCA